MAVKNVSGSKNKKKDVIDELLTGKKSGSQTTQKSSGTSGGGGGSKTTAKGSAILNAQSGLNKTLSSTGKSGKPAQSGGSNNNSTTQSAGSGKSTVKGSAIANAYANLTKEKNDQKNNAALIRNFYAASIREPAKVKNFMKSYSDELKAKRNQRNERADSLLKIGQMNPVGRAVGSAAKRNDLLTNSNVKQIAGTQTGRIGSNGWTTEEQRYGVNNAARMQSKGSNALNAAGDIASRDNKPETPTNRNAVYGKGNINLNERQKVKNPDGSFSTERSFSVNIDGEEVLLPTVINGKRVTEDEAIEHYRRTGENLGKFNTPEDADEYAQKLHNLQEQYYSSDTKKNEQINNARETLLNDQGTGMTRSFYDQSILNQMANPNSRMNQAYNNEQQKIVDNYYKRKNLASGEDLMQNAYSNPGTWLGGRTDEVKEALKYENARKYALDQWDARQQGLNDINGDVANLNAEQRQKRKGKIESGSEALRKKAEENEKTIREIQEENDRFNMLTEQQLMQQYGNEYRKYLQDNGISEQEFGIVDWQNVVGRQNAKRMQDLMGDNDAIQQQLVNNDKELEDINRYDEWDQNYEKYMDPAAYLEREKADLEDLQRQYDELEANGADLFQLTNIDNQIYEKEQNIQEFERMYGFLTDDVADDRGYHQEYYDKYAAENSELVNNQTYDTTNVDVIANFLNGGEWYQRWYENNGFERTINDNFAGVQVMTDSEKDRFMELYNEARANGRDPAEAKAFLDALQPYLNQRLRPFEELQNRANAAQYPVIMSAMTGLESTITALPQMAITGIGNALNLDFVQDPNSDLFATTRASRDTENQVAESLGPVGGFIYRAAMSGYRNFLRGMMTGGMGGAAEAATLVQFFGEAFNQTYLDQLEETGDAEKSGAYAVIDAAISTFFEVASVEKMFSDPTDYLQYVMQNMGAEMSEEAFEAMFGPYMHKLLDGTDQWADRTAEIYDSMVKQGMYQDETGAWHPVLESNKREVAALARKQAMQEWNREIFEGALSAAVSVGGPAAFGRIRNIGNNTRTGNWVLNQNRQRGMSKKEVSGLQIDNALKLVNPALEWTDNARVNNLAKQIDQDMRDGKKISPKAVGQLATAIIREGNDKIANVAQDVLGETFLKELKTNGVGQTEAADLTERLVRVITQGASTREQMLQDMVIIRENAAAQQILNDYGDSEARKQFLQGTEAAREAQNSVMELVTGIQGSGITTDSVSGLMAGALAAAPEDIAEADAAGKRSGSVLEVIADGLYSEIKGFTTKNVKGEDGKNHSVVMVQIGEGAAAREVDIAQVKGLSDGAAKVLQVIGADRGQVIGNETAKALLQIAGKATRNLAGTVSDAMNTMWAAAMEQKAPTTSLDAETEAQIRSAVQADMDAAEAKRLQNWRAIKPGQGTTTYNGLSYGTKEFNDALSKLGSTHRNEANVIGNYAKSMGVDVQLYYDENTSAQQGVYFGGQDGAGIRINLAGTINKEGAHRSAVATFAHEVTHNIEANSPTAYKALRSFVLQNMGSGLQNSLQHIMDNYAAHGESIDLNGALAELVAMGSEQVLTNENVATKLKEQDTTLYGRVKNAISELLDQIRGIRGDVMATSSRYARAMQNVGDQIGRLWVAAYEEAKGTTAPAENETGEWKYSINQLGLDEITKDQIHNIGTRGDIIAENEMDLLTFIRNAKNSNIQQSVFIGTMNNAAKTLLEKDTGWTDLFKDGPYVVGMVSDDIRHFDKHFKSEAEIAQAIIDAYGMIMNHDSAKAYREKTGQVKIELKKGENTIELLAVPELSKGKRAVTFKSIYLTKGNIKNWRSLNRIVTLRSFRNYTRSLLRNQSISQAQNKRNSQKSFSDEDYMDAVNNGDMEIAQRMVDEAAKKAGYTLKVYHGTPTGGFTVFRDWSYFTENKEYAERYNHASASSIRGSYETTTPKTYELYMNPGKVFDTRKAKERKLYNEARMEYGLNGLDNMKRGLPDWTDGRDIIEFLEDRGLDYDTILLDEGGDGGYGEEVKDRGISYVSRSNRVKSADAVTYDDNGNVIPPSERFKEEKKDIRFSMQMPVEERTDGLIAVHNMTWENLWDTLKEGGFTAPSIAIIKARMGHTKYGEISVVFKPSAIDPQANRQNKIYGEDAYTPTRYNADVETELIYDNMNKAADELAGLVEGLDEHLYNEVNRWFSERSYRETTNKTPEAMAEEGYNNEALMAAFLRSQGKEVPIKTRERYTSLNIKENRIDTYIEIMKLLARNGVYNQFIEDVEHLSGRKLIEKYMDIIAPADETLQKHRDLWKEKEFDLSGKALMNWMKQVHDYAAGGSEKVTEPDWYETKNAMWGMIDKKEFVSWLAEKLRPAFGQKGIRNNLDPFTYSGERRTFKQLHMPYTIENVVKAMYKNAEEKGQGGRYAKGVVATASKEYKTLDDVRADSDRLRMMDEEEYQKLFDDLDERIKELAEEILPDDAYTFDYALMQAGRAYARSETLEAIRRGLAAEGVTATREQLSKIKGLLDDAREIPTGYFEAKPMRVNDFSEIEKVIVPENAGDMMTDKLDQYGIPWETYDGSEEDRLRVLNEQTNALFSMQDDTDYDVKAWMETVPEWSLRTEAEKALLRSYGSLRRKGQMDQLRMEKINAEIRRLEGMQGKSETSEGNPVTTVTVDEALKANGIVQDGAMLKQNGVIIGSLQTGVLNIYDKYKEIRKKLQNSGAFEYDEKLHAWTAKAQNIYADQERDVQKRLGELRIRKQDLQKTMDETNEQLAKITGNEGFGNMMYRQQKVLEDLAYNKTQAEVRDSIEKMEKSAKRVQGIIDENRKKADELESSDVVKRFRELLGTTTADQTAAELKKEFSSTWTKKQIREFLDPIILKMKSGEDFQQDVETLAGILVNSDSRNTYEELEALRGLTITLGKGAQTELKAQNSSLKEIRARLAGTGITVKYGDRSTLEADIEDLRAEYPMIPELGDEKDALGNFVSWIEGMKNQSAGNEFYDQRLAEAMAVITGKAAGAAKGIYMPNDPKAQKQVLAMMDFVKGLNAETQQAQEALQQVADEMGAMQKAGREASGKTAVLMRDVNVALDYYNRISKISVDEAKQKRTSAIIEQLKSEQAQKIIKNNEEWRQLIQRDADARKQLDENRKAAAQINTSLRRMYNLLKAPKGTKNIPEYMQGLAREVLGIFAKNDADGGRRFLNSTRDGLAELQRLLEAWEKQDGPFDPSDLSAAEEAVTINLLQDLDIIREGITAINTPVNGKNKLDTLQQRGVTMRNIRDAVSEIYGAIRAEQEVQIGNRRVAVEDAAYKVAEATNGLNYREWTGKLGGAIRTLHKAIISGNMTPEYFFRTVGNEGLSDLWNAYHWAENRNGLELAKAQARLDEIAKQHGFDQWDMGQTIKLPLEGGETELTLGQLMSLWATWKREKTLGPAMSEHLTKGGFFAEKDLRDGILGRTTIERKAHKVTEEDMAKVRDLLTDEQRKFVDDVVLFMSRDMSELGNAASMAAYGIRMYKEKYYFPFQMWDGVKSRKSNDAGSAAAAQDRAFHPSFSKDRKHGADNAIAIGDFMQTATDHIAGMINYATMGLANETMQKVLNAQTAQGPYETKRNTRAILEEAYGKEVMQYLADLQLQLNGGAVRTSRSLGDKAISIFRKNAVAGSLSVALQQPLSYIRAAMLINPKYLTKAALSEYWKNSYKERMAYSGVSVIKEMGRFDMALGQSAREYLMPDGMESRGRKIWEGVKEYSTILPELMDRWTWNRMWVAVKAEQHALHPEMDVKSDAFLTMVGERFNEMMRRTQVYDSVLVKSANMRSDNYFVKSMTSFMAESTLTVNVLADAVRSAKQGEKGGKLLLAKAGATFILSAVLQSVFKALMSTGRTPDEKKTWWENFLYRWFANFQNEVDPMQLIPGYSDAITLLKDGKLQDDAMGALGKLFTAGQKGVDMLLGNGKNGWYRDLEDSVGQLVQLFSGLPLKNLMRDGRAMWNWAIDQPYADRPIDWNSVKYQTIDTFMNADNLWGVLMEKLGDSGYDTSNAGYYQRIYAAKKAGDEQAAQDMISYLLNGKGVKPETITSKMASMAKADTSATAEETAEFLMGEGKDPTDYIKSQLKEGKMSAEDARKMLQEADPKKDANEVWWMVDRIQYQIDKGLEKTPGGSYYRLWDAMDSNKTEEIRTAIKTMTDHGIEAKNIKTQITKQYKAAYLAADANGKRTIRDAIQKAYKLLGFKAEDADKVINKWK